MPHPEEPPGPTPPSRSEHLPATRLRPSRRGRVGRTIYFPADLIRVVDDQWREVAAEIPGGAGKTAFYIACIIAGLEDASRIRALLRADPHGASLARKYLAKQTSPGAGRPA
jgi:hypothetical protein